MKHKNNKYACRYPTCGKSFGCQGSADRHSRDKHFDPSWTRPGGKGSDAGKGNGNKGDKQHRRHRTPSHGLTITARPQGRLDYGASLQRRSARTERVATADLDEMLRAIDEETRHDGGGRQGRGADEAVQRSKTSTTQLGSPFATSRRYEIIDLCTPPPSDAGGIDAGDESDSFAPKIGKTSAQGAFQTPPQTPTTASPPSVATTATSSSTSTGNLAPNTPISISEHIPAITPVPSPSSSSKWATSPNERITVNHVYKPYAKADRWLMTPGDDAATRSAVDPGMKRRIASITAAGGRGRWPVSESEDERDELDSSDGEPDTTAGSFSSSTSHIPHRTNDLQCSNHSISQPRIDSRYCDQATQTENRNLWTVADFERRAAIAQTARELIGALQPLCKMSISETVEAAML